MKEPLDPARSVGLDDEFRESNEGDAQFSLLSLVATGLRHGRLILACGLALAVLQSFRSLSGERTYTSTVVFMMERSSGRMNTALQVAARFGLTTGESFMTYNPSAPSLQLVRRLLNSRSLRDSVGLRRYQAMIDGELKPVSLPELLDIRSRSDAQKIRRVRNWLGDAVQAQIDLASGIATVRVRTRWPHVSRDVASYMVDELNARIITLRQPGSEADVAFIEEQLRQAKTDRDAAEQAWLAFRDANRVFVDWSPLAVENGRLRADVSRLNGRYEALQAAYTEATTNLLRDTRFIAVIEPPFLPGRANSRQVALSGTSGLVGGCLLAFMAVLVVQYLGRAPSADFGELRKAWYEFAAPIPILRRLFRT